MTAAEAASQELARVVATLEDLIGKREALDSRQVGNLVWAMAMDEDLEFAFREAVRAERSALREEMEREE